MCSRFNQIGSSLPVVRVRLSRKDPDLTARIVICDPNPVRAARLSAPLAADGCRVRCEVTVPGDIGTAAHGDVLLLSVELWTAEQLQAARLEASFQAHVIVVLSSTDAEVATRYVEAGARDLLMPPFLPEQVIRRVRSASRCEDLALTDRAVQCNGLSIDRKRREIRRKGRIVALSANEFSVVNALVSRAGGITTTGMLRQALWGDEVGGTAKLLTAYVRAIRSKLEQDPDRPELLTTEPGVGYRWMPVEPVAS